MKRTIKPIPDFPGYFAGDDGTIWTNRPINGRGGPSRMRRKHPTKRRHGVSGFRLEVCLMRDGDRYYRTVARLVLEAFIGPRPPGMQACHRDDRPDNNRLKNLRWDTPKSNAADRDRNGGTHCGEKHHFSRLNAVKVKRIKLALRGGLSKHTLAKRYDVHYGTIARIESGQTWKAVKP